MALTSLSQYFAFQCLYDKKAIDQTELSGSSVMV